MNEKGVNMKLKPCPFCGSKAFIRGDYASYIVCGNPDCFMSAEHQHSQLLSESMAIKAWNTRFKEINND